MKPKLPRWWEWWSCRWWWEWWSWCRWWWEWWSWCRWWWLCDIRDRMIVALSLIDAPLALNHTADPTFMSCAQSATQMLRMSRSAVILQAAARRKLVLRIRKWHTCRRVTSLRLSWCNGDGGIILHGVIVGVGVACSSCESYLSMYKFIKRSYIMPLFVRPKHLTNIVRRIVQQMRDDDSSDNGRRCSIWLTYTYTHTYRHRYIYAYIHTYI